MWCVVLRGALCRSVCNVMMHVMLICVSSCDACLGYMYVMLCGVCFFDGLSYAVRYILSWCMRCCDACHVEMFVRP